jgi:hypothetical protein
VGAPRDTKGWTGRNAQAPDAPAEAFERSRSISMTNDHAFTGKNAGIELRDQAGYRDATTGNEAPPPPPPPPSGLAPPLARTDFTASAAMVNDILSVAPYDERPEDPPQPPDITDGEEVVIPATAAVPLASDFFTSAKKKKRFRHSR